MVRAKLDPAKLKEEQLDETYQQVLRAVEQMKVDELKRLRDLETKKPAEGIQAELSYIDGMLPKLKLIQEKREEGQKERNRAVEVTRKPARAARHPHVAAGGEPGHRGLHEPAQVAAGPARRQRQGRAIPSKTTSRPIRRTSTTRRPR